MESISSVYKRNCKLCGQEFDTIDVPGVDNSICFTCVRRLASKKTDSTNSTIPLRKEHLKNKYKAIIKKIMANKDNQGEVVNISKHQVARILYSFMSSEDMNLLEFFQGAKNYYYGGMKLEPKQLMEELITDVTNKINELGE